jgi:16S rRNA (cytidine1402-2'-O)-methyltransferase
LIRNRISVNTVPGPNAALAALSISGLPASEFTFLGFLPQRKGRQKKLKELAVEERTLVIYESTYRIEKLLIELNEYMPDRLLFICRELTKKFEETWRGYPKEILEDIESKTLKGEFVVVIAPLNWKEE